jgi:hypothetical protein
MNLLQLLLCTAVLLLVALTMFLRAHEHKGKRIVDSVRRVGLALSCLLALALVPAMWFGWQTTWLWTGFVTATFLVYFTDGQIPWHRWVWAGVHDEQTERLLREVLHPGR